MKKILLIALSLIGAYKSYAHEFYNTDSNNILKIYSEEDFMPFNYYDDMFNFKGFSVEIVEEILREAKFKHTNIKVMPWARAYHLTQKQPNSLLFTMYRTPLREDIFKWVGPISTSRIVLIAKKDRKLDENNYSVASVRSSASLQAIQSKNISEDRLLQLNDIDLGLILLNKERVDAWAVSEITAERLIKKHEFNPEDFYIKEVLSENEMFFAFNKDTPDSTINYFAEKLDALKKSGFINHLMQKYDLMPKIK